MPYYLITPNRPARLSDHQLLWAAASRHVIAWHEDTASTGTEELTPPDREILCFAVEIMPKGPVLEHLRSAGVWDSFLTLCPPLKDNNWRHELTKVKEVIGIWRQGYYDLFDVPSAKAPSGSEYGNENIVM
jgi:hypothetical protein